MFMGEYNHTIDPKGRLIVPSKFREALGEKVIVSRGVEAYISLCTKEEFEKRIEALESQPAFRGNVRSMKRVLLASASEPEFDKQGRILIPANLRDHAGLKKDVVLAGVGNEIEIWDKEKWEEVSASSYENIEMISEEIADAMYSMQKNQ